MNRRVRGSPIRNRAGIVAQVEGRLCSATTTFLFRQRLPHAKSSGFGWHRYGFLLNLRTHTLPAFVAHNEGGPQARELFTRPSGYSHKDETDVEQPE